MKKIKPVITLGILSMILTVGISVQLKTIKAADISGTIQWRFGKKISWYR